MPPILSKPSSAAPTSLFYITLGALMTVWSAIWYFYLSRNGSEHQCPLLPLHGLPGHRAGVADDRDVDRPHGAIRTQGGVATDRGDGDGPGPGRSAEDILRPGRGGGTLLPAGDRVSHRIGRSRGLRRVEQETALESGEDPPPRARNRGDTPDEAQPSGLRTAIASGRRMASMVLRWARRGPKRSTKSVKAKSPSTRLS